MRLSRLFAFPIFAVGAMLTACDRVTTEPAPDVAEGEPPRLAVASGVTSLNALWGRATLWAGEQVEIVAVATNAGTSGYAKDGLAGNVVELVPPSAAYTHWCVNVDITSDPTLQGFNVLFYIRDIGNGRRAFDEVGAAGGFGISCTSNPAPGPNDTPFAPALSGNFWTLQLQR